MELVYMLVLETSASVHKGSSPFLVTRKWDCDETGKHVGLKIQWVIPLSVRVRPVLPKWAVSKVGLCDGLKHRIFLFKSRTAHQKKCKVELDLRRSRYTRFRSKT